LYHIVLPYKDPSVIFVINRVNRKCFFHNTKTRGNDPKAASMYLLCFCALFVFSLGIDDTAYTGKYGKYMCEKLVQSKPVFLWFSPASDAIIKR